MPRRQWYAARLAAVAAASIVLAATSAPARAGAAEPDLVRWLTDTAAPALQAAAPTNDPALAARESLGRGLSGAFAQLREIGPTWLQSVQLGVSFDPTFRPSYALSGAYPLFKASGGEAAIDLHGGIAHDATGRTGGTLGLRYHGELQGRQVMLGLHGAIDDRWLQEVERYTIGAEVGLGPLEVRASGFDDVFRYPATPELAEHRLDGYDLEINARIPHLPWAWLTVHRLWQIAADGKAAIANDRLGLRLTPIGPLEIETGTQAQTGLRSWFARLRWRITLGG